MRFIYNRGRFIYNRGRIMYKKGGNQKKGAKFGTFLYFWGWLYGTRMETNVFVFTLFFSFPSLFSWYDIVQVPTNLGSKYTPFFLRERIFCEILQV